MRRTVFAETRTWPGSGEGRVNEDYAIVEPDRGCAVLVDGATGLTKANLVEGESDAAWYARELCRTTVALLADPTVSTAEALSRAGAQVAASYLALPGAEELRREDLPNGSVAVLRWSGGTMEVTMLGDCTAAVALADGSVRVVHDPTLDELDRQNYERMYAYAAQNQTTMAAARKAMNPHFIRNRLLMNEEGGYWAADVTCRGFGHELRRMFDLANVVGVFACSDGYASATEMGVAGDAAELTRRTIAGEGPSVAGALRAAELADAGCWRVHRSKTSDDATYVALAFAE